MCEWNRAVIEPSYKNPMWKVMVSVEHVYHPTTMIVSRNKSVVGLRHWGSSNLLNKSSKEQDALGWCTYDQIIIHADVWKHSARVWLKFNILLSGCVIFNQSSCYYISIPCHFSFLETVCKRMSMHVIWEQLHLFGSTWNRLIKTNWPKSLSWWEGLGGQLHETAQNLRYH